MPHRFFLPPAKQPAPARTVRKDAPAPPAPSWPTYTGQSEYVGTSPSGRVSVFVDPSLGAPGLQNATDLVHDADRVVTFNDSVFAASEGSVAVMVYALGGATDGTGGADHMGCDYNTGNAIEVCASFGQSMRCSALFEAELSECNMNGNLCGISSGEALSRWCAMAVSNNALADFATAPQWYAAGMSNWVDSVEGTDTDPISVGCGMAFLSWLQAQNFTLGQIAQAMVNLGNAPLCALYGQLTGNDPATAWGAFSAAVRALGGVSTDDPFAGGLPIPAPAPSPAPAPAPAPCALLSYVAKHFARELAREMRKPST
jgi:hypothetical protein